VATLTVRNVPDDAKHRFRQVAAAYGRSMEEHLRQLVIEADFGNAPREQPEYGVSDVKQSFKHFEPEPSLHKASRESWVHELVRLAGGAGEGVFDVGKHADIRFMSPKDAMAELRRLANGVGLDLPPRLNTKVEAPAF
jgi:hypothetical protein